MCGVASESAVLPTNAVWRRFLAEGSARKKSRTLSAEIQSEIQKSTLKSGNPI